jgi:hypothetical protein
VGTVRRELLDHVVVLGQDHLSRLLRQYIEYYNSEASTRRLAMRPTVVSSNLGLPTWPGSSVFLAWEVCTTDTPGLRLPDDRPARTRSGGRNARMNNGYRQVTVGRRTPAYFHNVDLQLCLMVWCSQGTTIRNLVGFSVSCPGAGLQPVNRWEILDSSRKGTGQTTDSRLFRVDVGHSIRT